MENEECTVCGGTHVIECDECRHGRVLCDVCKNKYMYENGEEVICEKCDGEGYLECEKCGGTQEIDCPECR